MSSTKNSESESGQNKFEKIIETGGHEIKKYVDRIDTKVEGGIEKMPHPIKKVSQGAQVVAREAVGLIVLPYKKRRSILDYFWKSKHGVITGAADNDPSGIVTYTQTGAIAGFRLLWLCLLAWPLLTIVESMSARIGVVTKKGITAVIGENYGKSWAYLVTLVVLVCNTITMGADIAAMSDIAAILSGISELIFVVVFGLLFFYLLWKHGYKTISNYLFILTPIFLLYIASAFLLPVPWGQALRDTVLPSFQSMNLDFILIAVAFLGTTLTPALIFWETSQEIEEGKTVGDLKKENMGVAAGMFFSQFITFFIIVAAAAAFAGDNHIIGSAREAALSLKPIGNGSFLFFSLGILGSGMLSVPVISASTAYMISETFGWRKGLDKTLHQAKGFYAVIIMTLLVSGTIAFFNFNPILALIYSQVLAGLLMPILLVFLILITNNKKIMGPYTNRIFSNIFGILAILMMVGADVALIYQWLR